jgi:hypothetical protein
MSSSAQQLENAATVDAVPRTSHGNCEGVSRDVKGQFNLRTQVSSRITCAVRFLPIVKRLPSVVEPFS